jgi:hypothetical protein
MLSPDFLTPVRAAARKKILFLPHAIRQMSRPDRMITAQEVRRVVLSGEIRCPRAQLPFAGQWREPQVARGMFAEGGVFGGDHRVSA